MCSHTLVSSDNTGHAANLQEGADASAQLTISSMLLVTSGGPFGCFALLPPLLLLAQQSTVCLGCCMKLLAHPWSVIRGMH
jgi:hypothetical protein